MTLLQNGNFEAIATNTPSSQCDTSVSNPFGLKDFSKLLDSKFGNSAFSNNLLEAPKNAAARNNIKSVNPFDSDGKWTRPNINDYTNTANNPYSIMQKEAPKASSVNDKKDTSVSIFQKEEVTPLASIFEGMQINKGTGMATGGRSKHKLDFCY